MFYRAPLPSRSAATDLMSRPLYYLCLALLVVGIGLLLAAAAQDLGGVAIFDDPPWITGVALATIGGLMVAGFKQKERAS